MAEWSERFCYHKPDLPGLTCYFAEGYRLQFHARDLVHLVRTNNLDLPGRPFENESPGGRDPNVLASSHIDRVIANSVYGKRLPFSGS
jgi:hypothetical protein